MIKAISREQVFEMSNMADVEIAARQRFYFKSFDGEDPAIIDGILPFYDHRVTLFNNNNQTAEFCIMVYDDELNGSTYENGFLLDHASLANLIPLLFYNNPDEGD